MARSTSGSVWVGVALGLGAAAGCRPTPLDPSLLPVVPTELSIVDPPAAAMVPAGAATVRGEVVALSDLTLNGVPVTVTGERTWEAEVELPRGITTFELAGTDNRGDRVYLRQSVLAGDFAPAKGALPASVGIRLNQGGLDAASGFAADLLDPAGISALLPSLNPVYEDSYGLFGLDAVTIAADISALAFDPPEIALDPGAGALAIEIVLPNLDVTVPVSGEAIGIDFDEELSVSASEVVVSGFLEVATTRDGGLSASLVDPEVALHDFSFDTSILPGPVEGLVLSDALQGVLEDLLVDQIAALVPPLLDDQLASLAIAFDTELLGQEMSFAASFDTVSIDRDGIQLVADLDLDLAGPFPRSSVGYLVSGAPEPRPSTDPDLAVLLSDDVVNRLLHDTWRAGMLDLALSTDDGSLDGFVLAPFGSSTGSITMDAGLPPVLVQHGDQATLELGELTVTIDTPGGTQGNRLVVTAAGAIPLDVELTAGALTMGLGTPALSLMVRESDWGATNESLTDLLEHQLPIDVLLGLLGDLAIPMPTLGDLVIPDAAVGRDPSTLFTTIDMDL
ncbi:MAG: hypothetical protein ABMB14_01255 [Myxococcota bacterium]